MNMEEMIRSIVREELENMVKESAEKEPEEIDVSEEANNIDRILAGEKKEQRTFRGFYWDKDIINFLDGIKHGNKSDLMNEIVSTVLKEKGLIK